MPPELPGDEVMGRFDFVAQPSVVACSLSEVTPTELRFSVIYSRSADGTQYWTTLNGISETATFDGQYASSVRSADRIFPSCRLNAEGGLCSGQARLQESLRVAFLSSSQNAFLGGACPSNPLDTPLPNAPESGVTPPGLTTGSFDALRACGRMEEVVIPGSDCVCGSCQLIYDVTGVRK